ncbi:head decoration protein [Desulfosarcina sp. OttesenSCG-928-A07]|nr:head decoration protein [Desulfosarcina sp. OttesenSCG-928-G17]MDL2329079.1 head decoration protein [Desulfosarcina sp. OttesenSCG-928-A07]
MARKTLREYSEDAPRSLSEVLLVEVNRNWCRDSVDLAPTTVDLPVGAVLARTDDGAFVPYLTAAGDNQAAAVLVTPKSVSDEVQAAVVISRGARVAASGLAFLSTVTDEEKQTAYGQLTALGIIVEA